ncbi:MAG: HD domain-containing phosphohydrolase [Smithella sp.]|jgi:response regulator RpfG family c-di-GMP phosphodiesterase
MVGKVQPDEKQGLKKILVVDDYLPTRNLIVETLSQSSQYQIAEAENGKEALRMFDENDFDLVISDIMMPGMSGMELLRLIRDRNPSSAVIMITGNPTTDLTVNAIKKGAVDFLTKPFDIDELLYKVDIHLRQKDMLPGEPSGNILEQNKLNDQKDELSKQGYIYDSIEGSPMDNDVIFNKIAELALKLVDGEVCSIMLFDEQDNEFHDKVVKGNTEGMHNNYTSSPTLKMVFNEVIERKEAVLINSNDHPEVAPSLICAPLMIRNNILGILSIRKKKNREVFSKKDLHHILSLTKRASLNLENKILYESIFFNIMDTLKSLISSIQARDHYTEEHSQRVTNEAIRLAASMNCPSNDLESIKIAGALHDVGKIAVPDSILLKAGKLTDEEYMVIKNHPTIGENILKSIVLLDKERMIIQCHHERWDGNGYPQGLRGPDIPFLARILSVVDSFDAMTNNRPYRSALSKEDAVEELIRNKNTQFDPDIVDAYIKIL